MAHRRHLGLYRAPAARAQERSRSLGVHEREDRSHRRARARSRARFSDLQADIATELVRRGIEVHVFNQRNIDGILRVIRTLGGLIGCEAKASALADPTGIRARRRAYRGGGLARRPRVWLEEWDEPQISAIRWVSELIGVAGGDDVFRSSRCNRWVAIESSPIRSRSCVALPT
jgi:hypothetical protein